MGAKCGLIFIVVVVEAGFVAIMSLFESLCCQSGIVLSITIICGDRGLVHHILFLALAGCRTSVSATTTIATRLRLFLLIILLAQIGIMTGYFLANVWHALVRYLDSISIEQPVQGVVWGE